MNKKFIFIAVAAVALIFVIGFSIYLKFSKSKVSKTSSANSQITLNSQGEWSIGSGSNTDLNTSVGSIKISNKVSAPIDLKSLYEADNSRITANIAQALAPSLVDGVADLTDPITHLPVDPWSDWCATPGDTYWWKMDLGSTYNINRVEPWISIIPPPYNPDGTDFDTNNKTYNMISVYTSTDDANYTLQGDTSTFGYGDNVGAAVTFSSAQSVRYIKLQTILGAQPPAAHCTNPDPIFYAANLYEVTAYQSGSATHTSAATQIDGSEGGTKNFITWQTFTPTYTTPANTTVSYKFRTSPDSTT